MSQKKIKPPSQALGEDKSISPLSFTPTPKPAPEPEKVEEAAPVNVSVNVSTDSIVEALTTQSAANFAELNKQIVEKAEKWDIVQLQESIEVYVDELRKKIDALDIRYYEEEINAVYNNLGELADAVDSNLEVLSQLTGRNTRELRDEFSVLHKELQESFDSVLAKTNEDVQKAHDLYQELSGTVTDFFNQESRFDPTPLLETLETLKEEFNKRLDDSHVSLSETIKNLPEPRYYEKDLTNIREFVDEVRSSIRYYDTDVESLTKNLNAIESHLTEQLAKKAKQLQESIKKSAKAVREDIPTVPEIKYYDDEIAIIQEGILNIQNDLKELPEVRYYDEDVSKLGMKLTLLNEKLDGIEIPDWTEAIQALKEEVGSMKEEQASLLTESGDPIAPQNMDDFVTIDEFKKHYRTFLERVQIQLGSLGGGGAVNILDMDDLDEAVRLNPQDFQGDVLALNYDPTTRVTTFVAVPNGGGGPGSVGATGATGATGAPGAPSTVPGATGATGPQGATGPSGTGATGASGSPGSPGGPGDDGATGATGIQGATGPQGPDGQDTGGFFQVAAERNGSPGNNQLFAFGNGGSGNVGVVITEDCILNSIAFNTASAMSGALTIIPVINGVNRPEMSAVGAVGLTSASSTEPGISVTAGDTLQFRCIQTGGGGQTVVTGSLITSGVKGGTGATGPQGSPGGATGATGNGFTGGSYNPENGQVQFTSDDGLGFVTGDLRGATGATGPIGLSGATGPVGPSGTGIQVLGKVADIPALLATTPTAQGDLYIVENDGSGTPNVGYSYIGPPANPAVITSWADVGPIQGPQGATGPSIGAVHAKVGCDGPINVNTGELQAFTNFNIFNTTSQFDSGGFVFEADGITIPTGQDGIWQVSYAFYFESGVQRGVPLGRLSINGTESGEICATAYIRSQNGNNESSLTFTTLVQLTGGDKVNVLIARGGQTGTVNIQPDPLSSISFMRIA